MNFTHFHHRQTLSIVEFSPSWNLFKISVVRHNANAAEALFKIWNNGKLVQFTHPSANLPLQRRAREPSPADINSSASRAQALDSIDWSIIQHFRIPDAIIPRVTGAPVITSWPAIANGLIKCPIKITSDFWRQKWISLKLTWTSRSILQTRTAAKTVKTRAADSGQNR